MIGKAKVQSYLLWVRLLIYHPILRPTGVKIGELQRRTQAARASAELWNVVSLVVTS